MSRLIQLSRVEKLYPVERTGLPLLTGHGEKVRALGPIDLRITSGEKIGIIGRNGAGKTTLAKMIAGLIRPSRGDLTVEGQVNYIMALGESLLDEKTGRENIFLDGALRGRPREQIESVLEEIIQFSELEASIDYPVRTYSAGMRARLGFALMVQFEPDILVVDEALSVGDSHFNQKARERMELLCQKGQIVILISHEFSTMMSTCERCLWLDQGVIRRDSSIVEVVEAYRKASLCEEPVQNLKQPSTSAFFEDETGVQRNRFETDESYSLVVLGDSAKESLLEVEIRNDTGVLISRSARKMKGSNRLRMVEGLRLGQGSYEWRLRLTDSVSGESLLSGSLPLFIENFQYPQKNPVFFGQENWQVVN